MGNRHELDTPEIVIAQGKLRGQTNKMADGTTYYSFKGIPYAEPPVGKLRFKAPVPASSWQGVYDAKNHGPICPQMDMITGKVLEGSENCLFLNVYTKNLFMNSANLVPVMVFIHGGAFMSGSGDSDFYGPEYLLQHNVILVTLNYRLEALGFLCLDIEEVPGNAGMKDQVLALKWVKDNIAKFGGDPNNITIFGESAGGASVTYHLVSPMTKGLFNKAISQSGVFLNDWAYSDGACERAFRLGKHLGKETNDPKELLDFLQSVPVKDLVKVTLPTMLPEEKYRGLPIHFCPVIEKSFPNVKSYLNKPPLYSLLNKEITNVPLLLGYNNAEAIIMLNDNIKKADFINKHFQYKVPREIAKNISEAKCNDYGQRIKLFYFGDTGISETTLDQVSGYMEIEGACHADELFYLFDCEMVKDTVHEDKNLHQLVYTITKLWTNFAKHGNKIPDNTLDVQWAPYTTGLCEYLSIDSQLKMSTFANKDRTWDPGPGPACLYGKKEPVMGLVEGCSSDFSQEKSD
ncbi:Esterase FE4 [Eumeta japonica]|uniref:Carboxylic ester hydrolase n=1 Tax=Eumeta variegata TaxID=151549 RepID=A0A4C1YGH9_EUMVA|nr:Esterase FE4 [Eumeta japonica]